MEMDVPQGESFTCQTTGFIHERLIEGAGRAGR
jgi:hypothetical protein